MAIFLVVHTRYADVQFSIVKQHQFLQYSVISTTVESNKLISKNFIKIIENLLKTSSLSFKDLDFIASHTGPAPFTTLRACLASINGLAFATQKPLIGINGLEALINQYSKNTDVVALLNAFANDVYYGIKKDSSKTIEIGHDNITQFLERGAATCNSKTLFIGNGAIIYKKLIEEKVNNLRLEENIPEIADINSIIELALINWNAKENIEKQLMPVYIKPYIVQTAGKSLT